MATYTADIVWNQAIEQFEFVAKGKKISFQFLPDSLYVRGKIEDRDPSYLVELPGDNSETYGKAFLPGSSVPTVHYQNPFVVFPKSFFSDQRCQSLGCVPSDSYTDTYVLVQGNTRYKGLLQLFDYEISRYQAANTAGKLGEWESSRIQFDPVSFQIMSEESASSPGFIQWMQNAINDGVEKHTPLQQMEAIQAHIQFLKSRHPDMSMADIYEKVAEVYNYKVPRVKQLYGAAKSFPLWLKQKVSDNALALSAADMLQLDFRKRIEPLNLDMTRTLEQFYDECIADVYAAATNPHADDLKITRDSIPKTVKRLVQLASSSVSQSDVNDEQAERSEILEEGTQSSENPTDSTSTSAPKNPYVGMTAEDLETAFVQRSDDLAGHVVTVTSSDVTLTEASKVKFLIALDAFLAATTLTTGIEKENAGKLITVDMQNLIVQAKQIKADAAKAAKADEAAASKVENIPVADVENAVVELQNAVAEPAVAAS